MSAPEHYSTDDELTEDCKVPRQTCQCRVGPQTEAHVAVGADTFEHDGEDAESCVLRVGNLLGLRDADAEGPQEDVPEIKAELVAYVLHHVARRQLRFLGLRVCGISSQRGFLVGVAAAHAHGNGEDGDIHHREETELHGRIDFGEVERCGAGVASAGCLERRCQDPGSHWEGIHFWVVQVEDDDQKCVDEIHDEQDAKQDPCYISREEQGVASSRMVEQKLQRLAQRAPAWHQFLHHPQNKPENDRVARIAGEREKRKQHHRPGCVSEADHAVGCESESKIADHCLSRVDSPPDVVLAVAGKHLSILGRAVKNPRHKPNDTKNVQASVQRNNDLQQQLQAAVLDASQLFTVMWCQSTKVGVSADGDLV